MLRVQSARSINPKSEAEAVVARKYTNFKFQLLMEAVEWCKERERFKETMFPKVTT